ncbi:glycosyltransferase involved in cell wall biosynthesis [Mesorhizobium soli]|uniref:glycosyltransferase n=1 Tax=Pseudaminobacter soli (ex Li et al. 2025) TaxID=1295366 RepID=UPI00247596D3|nr:glycosyltransferase [Mesorhizobium soli]MDH6229820.1 glycosyltransferase involved in cell wall biosynthesis [Mesorhizobium soli]
MRHTSLAQLETADHYLSTPSSAARVAGIDRNSRIAVVHDWCPDFRGGERVLARICSQLPNAEIFTLFDFLPEPVKQQYFHDVEFHASAANRLPMIRKYYRALFFLCPFLIEQFDVTGYDAVISSSAAFSRGVITRPDQPHLCYVHSPVRYAWDEQFSYLDQANMGFGPKGMLFRYMLHRLREWDTRTAHGPDLMLANSTYVRTRIKRIYGRDARVVFPPVSLGELAYVEDKDDYYVSASFLAPYKRTDLVIEAFNEMPSRRLVVVGEGQQSARLRALAGPNVTFAGFLSRNDYVRTIAQAKAMVFAGCEDFGIALAEAQACGTPLIAFSRGGATDIVRRLGVAERPTGVLFDRQTIASLNEAIDRFEESGGAITPESCWHNSLRFSEERFDREFGDAVDSVQSPYTGIA